VYTINLHDVAHFSLGVPIKGTRAPCGYLWGSDPKGDRPAPQGVAPCPMCFNTN